MTPAERQALVLLLDVARAVLKAIDSFTLTPVNARLIARQQLARVDAAITALTTEENKHGGSERRHNDSAGV